MITIIDLPPVICYTIGYMFKGTRHISITIYPPKLYAKADRSYKLYPRISS